MCAAISRYGRRGVNATGMASLNGVMGLSGGGLLLFPENKGSQIYHMFTGFRDLQ